MALARQEATRRATPIGAPETKHLVYNKIQQHSYIFGAPPASKAAR